LRVFPLRKRAITFALIKIKDMKKVIIVLALLVVSFNMKAEDKKEQSTKPVILNAGIGVSNWGLPIF
jgi:hypothetical protein